MITIVGAVACGSGRGGTIGIGPIGERETPGNSLDDPHGAGGGSTPQGAATTTSTPPAGGRDAGSSGSPADGGGGGSLANVFVDTCVGTWDCHEGDRFTVTRNGGKCTFTFNGRNVVLNVDGSLTLVETNELAGTWTFSGTAITIVSPAGSGKSLTCDPALSDGGV